MIMHSLVFQTTGTPGVLHVINTFHPPSHSYAHLFIFLSILLLIFIHFHFRIINYDSVIPLKNLKANYFGKYFPFSHSYPIFQSSSLIIFFPSGKFVAICGTVVRVSNVKPLVIKMGFSCNLCAYQQVSVIDKKVNK